MIAAAGILIVDKADNALFLQRGPGGDSPGLWCFPGGRIEEGETALDAAVRETEEETGFKADPKACRELTRRVADGVDFTTFLLQVPEQFIPVLGPAGTPEHIAYAWAPMDQPPQPLHPGCLIALQRQGMTETDVAKMMAAGELASPQDLDNSTLFLIRITGTGTAFRSRFNENVLRPSEHYLSQEFLDRCNGLPVILVHPKKQLLTSKEFKELIVGTIVLPFIRGDEVWGVARILDAGAIALMKRDPLSTSPAVAWNDPADNTKFFLESGETFLVEGKPSLIDHVAIVERGVWDKGPPDGVESITARGDDDMKIKLTRLQGETDDAYEARCKEAEKLIAAARADAEGENNKLLQQVAAVTAALDEANKRMERIEADNKARADAEEAAKKEEEEERRADARRRADNFKFSRRADDEDDDAYKARHDAEEKECADAEEEAGETKEAAADKAKRRRADAEEEEEKERDSRSDSATIADLRRRVDDLTTIIETRTASRTDEELDGFASVQARADDVYSGFGKSAPRPMDGESLLQYRRRLLEGVQAHTEYKDVNLRAIAADSAAFDVVERQMLQQAATIARSPASVPPGELREVTRTTKTGHIITDFLGDPKTWMAGHAPVGQAAIAIGVTKN